MTDVTMTFRADKSLQYRVDDILLWGISYVTIKRDDWTKKHSPFAEALFKNPNITEVSITDAPAGQYVTIKSSTSFSKSDEAAFADFIKASIKYGPLINEEALVKEANATPQTPALDKDFSSAVAHYVQNEFVPLIAKETKHEAGMEFIRFYKEKDSNALIAGITLRNACGGCSVSVFGTLRQLHKKLNEYAQNTPGIPEGSHIKGLIVLPDSKGSPSFSFIPPAARAV